MRVTRSATRALAIAPLASQGQGLQSTELRAETKNNGARGRKRKAADEAISDSITSKEAKKSRSTGKVSTSTKQDVLSTTLAAPLSTTLTLAESAPEALVPAVLTLSFEDAKNHLIKADDRFEHIFDRVHCKPFEHLEQVDPFRCVEPLCATFDSLSELLIRRLAL